MTSHKDHRLDQLGIASQDEADELQRELGIRFDRFTYHDRKVWNQQNSYLQAHARTRTVSDSADLAGVTVSTAQAWKYLDTLGFTHRLEIADLRFSDSLQVTALERAREPDAPASLLIALLRAHIPEKYSSNGHLCDTSKSDELLFHYRQDAQRELAAGHPTLRAIANGTYQPPHNDNLSCPISPPPEKTPHTPNPSFTAKRHVTPISPPTGKNPQEVTPDLHGDSDHREGASSYDAEETTPTRRLPSPRRGGLRPLRSLPNRERHTHPISPPRKQQSLPLSPTGGETQRGGSPSAVNRHPIASLHQTRRRPPHNDHNTFKVVRF